MSELDIFEGNKRSRLELVENFEFSFYSENLNLKFVKHIIGSNSFFVFYYVDTIL